MTRGEPQKEGDTFSCWHRKQDRTGDHTERCPLWTQHQQQIRQALGWMVSPPFPPRDRASAHRAGSHRGLLPRVDAGVTRQWAQNAVSPSASREKGPVHRGRPHEPFGSDRQCLHPEGTRPPRPPRTTPSWFSSFLLRHSTNY